MRPQLWVLLLILLFGCRSESDSTDRVESGLIGLIPSGWILEYDTASRDLIPGKKVQLIVLRDTTDAQSNLGSRRLLVLDTEADGMKVIGTSEAILQPVHSGMLLIEPIRDYIQLKLDVISLHTEWKTGGAEYKFRYDPKADAFMLIGFDMVDALIHDSRNYLTRKRIVKLSLGKELIRSLPLRGRSIRLEQVTRDNFEIDASNVEGFATGSIPESVTEQ